MAEKYLEQLTDLIRQATSGRFRNVRLECKHFFSGAAVYANGRICMSFTPAGFAIKLPGVLRNVLVRRKGTKPLRYFSKGPIKKGYVVVPQTMRRQGGVRNLFTELLLSIGR